MVFGGEGGAGITAFPQAGDKVSSSCFGCQFWRGGGGHAACHSLVGAGHLVALAAQLFRVDHLRTCVSGPYQQVGGGKKGWGMRSGWDDCAPV